MNDVNIKFVKADILKTTSLGERYNIIVSNPPYVRGKEIGNMRNNVLQNEPLLALFVPDEDPLLFYRAIAQLAVADLAQNGVLYLEINQYLGADVKGLLKEFNFSDIELRKDIFGNDRMIKARKPA